MELFPLHSPPVVTYLPSSSWGRASSMEKPSSFSGQVLWFPSNSRRVPSARNASSLDFRPRASGSTPVATRSSPKTGEAIKEEIRSKDNDIAFVAGATGRVGSRSVRELLRLGFQVRAGVRSAQRAEALVQSVREMKLDDITGSPGTQPVEKLEIVECDLENKYDIRPAIGNASVVLCCIGASEKEVFDVTGPYRIDYKATKNLIEAATVAKVDHFILLTSLGTNKIGFPASILNLFWGVLYWKRRAEEALIASGLPYTIVRPGGMERPTDLYKETHNLVLANEDTYFGGQVSNLQVAELMAFMAKNRRLSFCKVVEVIAETTAPLTPMEELLAKIPPQQELPVEPKPDHIPLSVESKSTSSVVQKESGEVKLSETRPLSPYSMYDDLKPPTSPTPTPSTTPGSPKELNVEMVETKSERKPSIDNVIEKEQSKAPLQKARPLSPFIVYEDLKPPTSPMPTPSSASKGLEDGLVNAASPLESNTGNDGVGTPSVSVNKEEISQIPSTNSNHQSPYYAISQDPTPDESGDQQHVKEQKSMSLSPFTMYEDLKPPSSPVPSVPKH